MNMKLRLQIASFIMLCLLLLSSIVIGIYFLMTLLYQMIGYTPPLFLIQVINTLLGLFFFFLIIISFFTWNNSRQGVRVSQMRIFQPIFEAMERIARGDFQVRLSPTSGNNIIASELVKSVNQMAEELNQMEHLRQEFTSNVSHEIQSPLTSIHGFTRALYNEDLSIEDRHHYLGIIESESLRLSRITENMLRLASLESAHTKVGPGFYRLDKQIRNLILACEPQWTSKAIDMDITLAEVEILADEDLLGQVWSNLLHNSIKFTPKDGKVSVELSQRDKLIECRISDTGIGIPEEAQARIFERFYKVDKSRERSQGGSGLGLAITKKIIELHQGTIKVASRVGAGTTFFVSLPVE
jgi:two-component system phosphate regulon sensor histidine kinase PhoR